MKNLQKKLKTVALTGCLLLGMSAFQNAFAEGGTNTGHSDAAKAYLAWCGSAGATLDNVLDIEGTQYDIGNYLEAKHQLIRGLDEAMAEQVNPANRVDVTQSITYRVLDQGRKIAASMSDFVSPETLQFQVQILERYYDFAHKVVNTLDPIYIPYHLHDRNRMVVSQLEFERRYVRFANDQIQWLLKSFIFSCGNAMAGEPNKVCIKGSDSLFFIVAEQVIDFAVADLNDSLFNNAYACVAKDLTKLQGLVNQYNAGMSVIGDAPRALNKVVYPRLVQYSNQMEVGCSR